MAERLEGLREENQRLKAELETWRELGSRVLSRILEVLEKARDVEEAGELVWEVARLRERVQAAAQALGELEQWRSAWLCYYVTPHEEPLAFKREYPDGLPRIARERHKSLARKVKVLREKWYRELTALPLIRLGKVFIAPSEAAARAFLSKYSEIFDTLLKQLKSIGYNTQATCSCIPVRMLPQQLVELLGKEIEETKRELALAEMKLLQLRAAARDKYHAKARAQQLRRKLQQLEAILRQLQREHSDRKLPALGRGLGLSDCPRAAAQGERIGGTTG